jgi:hypothetical protein
VGYIDFIVSLRFLSAVDDDPYTYDTGVWGDLDVAGDAEAARGAFADGPQVVLPAKEAKSSSRSRMPAVPE